MALRTAAAAGLSGVALVTARVAEATGVLDDGAVGRLAARLDVAASVLVVLLLTAAWRPLVAARLGATAEAWTWRRYRTFVAEWLVPLYALWIPVVVLNEVMLNPSLGPRSLLAHMVLFRDPRSVGPAPGLRIGAALFVVASAIVVLPLLDRLAGRLAGSARTALLRLAALLVVTGVVVRAVLLAIDADAPFGAVSWLPAQLDLVGAALAIATLLASGSLVRTNRTVAGAIGAAVAVYAAGAFAAGLPRSLLVVGATDIQVRAVLYVAVAAAVTVAVETVPSPARRPAYTLAAGVAVAAPGLVLAGEMSFVMLARQYREAFADTALGLRLDAAAVPILLWSLCTAAAIGVLLTALFLVPLRRVRTGRWPANPYPIALAAVVAGGFAVRVATWLAVAPEKTDGGDPLFYHVTANALAAGRGFPEPLNWLDSETHVASALHGPLYPVVLSFASRLGGTTYVDHKFLSILIGTATVLLTALVAERLAGRRAAIAAGLLAAIYPNLWLIDSLLFPEGLFAMLTTAAVLVAYRWRDRPTVVRAAGLGALVGLAGLTRGEGLLLGVVLVAPWVLLTRQLAWRRRWQHLVVAGATCVAVLAPWTIRNLTTFDDFVPVSTNGNELIVYANCPDVYAGRLIGFWSFQCQVDHRAEFGEPPGDEAEKARYWRDVGFDYARDHLGEVPKIVAIRVLRQWELFRPWQTVEFSTIENRDKDSAAVGLAMYYVLLVGAVAGAVMLRRRRVPMLPLAAQVVSVTVTAAYAYGTVRFRAPVEPVLCVLAGVVAVPVAARLRSWLAPGDLAGVPPDAIPAEDETAYVLGGSGGLRRLDRGALRTWAGIGVVLAAVAVPLRGLYRTTGGTMEEGFMLYFPERMWKGDVPNVDFLHLYGPGALHVLMVWYEAFGYTLGAERTFGLLQHLGIIFGLYALARPWGRGAATAVAVLSTLLVLTPIGLTAMAWNGGLALVLWSAVFALRATNVSAPRDRLLAWLASGALAGFALTFRPDLVLAIGLALGWLVWHHRAAWRPLLAGAVVGAIPMWVHLAVAGIRPSIQGMVLDPVVELRSGRELPRPPSWDRLDGALQAIAEQEPPWWRIPSLTASASLYLWFWAMIVVAIGSLVLALVLYRRTGGAPRTAVLVVGSLLGIGVVPQALQRPDSTHLSWVTCISWPFAVVGIVELVRLVRPVSHPRLRVAVGASSVAVLMFVVAPLFTYRYYLNSARVSVGDVRGALPVERDGRRFYLGDERPYRATRDVIATLDDLAAPGERLFVGPQDLRRTWYGDTFFYWMFPELDPATYYLEMDPGLANAEDSGLADDVAGADWVILTGFWNGWREPNSSMEYGSDAPNRVIEEQFCEVASFEDDLVLLYRRCDS
jgi:4-amino-4-deoxy-L-arabinose transferase-like glycosyltransferase